MATALLHHTRNKRPVRQGDKTNGGRKTQRPNRPRTHGSPAAVGTRRLQMVTEGQGPLQRGDPMISFFLRHDLRCFCSKPGSRQNVRGISLRGTQGASGNGHCTRTRPHNCWASACCARCVAWVLFVCVCRGGSHEEPVAALDR